MCGNDTIFGEVDRVDIRGPNPIFNSSFIAIEASGEGYRRETCNDLLSGTFKVNRSTFFNLGAGIITSMRAAPPVDIRFNDFSFVDFAVVFKDSNQDTTVVNNEFTLSSYLSTESHGVLVETTVQNPPAASSVRVSRNQFIALEFALAVRSYQLTGPANIVFLIVFNTFDYSATNADGFAALTGGINSGVVNGNSFLGTNGTAVFIENGDVSPGISDWSITGNSSPDNLFFVLDTQVSDSIIGPNQTSNVVNRGFNNSIL